MCLAACQEIFTARGHAWLAASVTRSRKNQNKSPQLFPGQPLHASKARPPSSHARSIIPAFGFPCPHPCLAEGNVTAAKSVYGKYDWDRTQVKQFFMYQ
jgi:hypothetical protein